MIANSEPREPLMVKMDAETFATMQHVIQIGINYLTLTITEHDKTCGRDDIKNRRLAQAMEVDLELMKNCLIEFES